MCGFSVYKNYCNWKVKCQVSKDFTYDKKDTLVDHLVGEFSAWYFIYETCDDGKMNQDEEGVDCGGETCDACKYALYPELAVKKGKCPDELVLTQEECLAAMAEQVYGLKRQPTETGVRDKGLPPGCSVISKCDVTTGAGCRVYWSDPSAGQQNAGPFTPLCKVGEVEAPEDLYFAASTEVGDGCPDGTMIYDMDECLAAAKEDVSEDIGEVREFTAKRMFMSGCHARGKKVLFMGKGPGKEGSDGLHYGLCKRLPKEDDVDTSCETGEGDKCKACVAEGGRTGPNQCSECNEGYNLAGTECTSGYTVTAMGEKCADEKRITTAEACEAAANNRNNGGTFQMLLVKKARWATSSPGCTFNSAKCKNRKKPCPRFQFNPQTDSEVLTDTSELCFK